MGTLGEGKGCTAKALVIGLLGAVFLGLGSTYNDMIIKGSGLAVWNLTPGAIFCFLFSCWAMDYCAGSHPAWHWSAVN